MHRGHMAPNFKSGLWREGDQEKSSFKDFIFSKKGILINLFYKLNFYEIFVYLYFAKSIGKYH